MSEKLSNTQSPGPPIECCIALRDEPREVLHFEGFSQPFSLQEGYSNTLRKSFNTGRSTATKNLVYGGGDFEDFDVSLLFVAGLNRLPNPIFSVPFAVKNLVTPGLTQSATLSREQELQEMEAKVRWCMALCFPRERIVTAASLRRRVPAGNPPRVLVTYGSFMVIEGQVQRVAVRWGSKGMFDPETVRPYTAEVELSIVRLQSFYPDWYSIKKTIFLETPFNFSAVEVKPPVNTFDFRDSTEGLDLPKFVDGTNVVITNPGSTGSGGGGTVVQAF